MFIPGICLAVAILSLAFSIFGKFTDEYDTEAPFGISIVLFVTWAIFGTVHFALNPDNQDLQNHNKEYIQRQWDTFNDIHEQWKLGWTLFKWMMIAEAVIFITFLIVYFIKHRKTKIEKDIEVISLVISNLNYKTDPESQAIRELLIKSLEKAKKQMALGMAYEGIKAAKRLNDSVEQLDIRQELDELEAIYNLEDKEMEMLKNKYE